MKCCRVNGVTDMLRFLLNLSLLSSTLFALAIGVIRAQPYDDGGLRGFLFNSPGCETIPDDEPCFIGIRPGVTTADEAVAILEAHEWVGIVNDFGGVINWRWSGRQPFLIDDADMGTLFVGNGNIQRVEIGYTFIKLGDLSILLGIPKSVMTSTFGSRLDFYVEYIENGLIANVMLSCPSHQLYFWLSAVNVYFHNGQYLLDLHDFHFEELCAA
jgi:hypothetical protein